MTGHASCNLAVKLLIRPAAPGRAGVENSGRTGPPKGTQASQDSGHARRLTASPSRPLWTGPSSLTVQVSAVVDKALGARAAVTLTGVRLTGPTRRSGHPLHPGHSPWCFRAQTLRRWLELICDVRGTSRTTRRWVLDIAPHHERQLRCVVCQGPIPPGREQFAVLVDSSVIDSRDPDKDGRRLVIASAASTWPRHEQQRRSGAMNNCGRRLARAINGQRRTPTSLAALAHRAGPSEDEAQRALEDGGRATTPRVSPMPTPPRIPATGGRDDDAHPSRPFPAGAWEW